MLYTGDFKLCFTVIVICCVVSSFNGSKWFVLLASFIPPISHNKPVSKGLVQNSQGHTIGQRTQVSCSQLLHLAYGPISAPNTDTAKMRYTEIPSHLFIFRAYKNSFKYFHLCAQETNNLNQIIVFLLHWLAAALVSFRQKYSSSPTWRSQWLNLRLSLCNAGVLNHWASASLEWCLCCIWNVMYMKRIKPTY